MDSARNNLNFDQLVSLVRRASYGVGEPLNRWYTSPQLCFGLNTRNSWQAWYV
jgi:hypothetical protein